MKLDLRVQCAIPKSAARSIPPTPEIRRWARAALAGLRHARIGLLVRIVDETESAMLNQWYRNKRGPTNVLSFFYGRDANRMPGGTLGDIVICAPLVVREARENRKKIKAHWAHLVVHAILHLRGHDHQNPVEAARMEALETRVLHGLGFPDPYA
jgi:probable rRNA maturation factor